MSLCAPFASGTAAPHVRPRGQQQQQHRRGCCSCVAQVQHSASPSSSASTSQPLNSSVSRSSSTSSSSRREMLAGVWTVAAAAAGVVPLAAPLPASAGFKKELKKRRVDLEDYTVSEFDGLRFYDKEPGRGRTIAKGDTVTVHFDCKFRGIDAVSSRYARTLGGNRTIAEPLQFVAGEPVNMMSKKAGDSAGGLFVGGFGPKPPPAISTAVIGMKPGGRRLVYVDAPQLGYEKGNQEIPAGAAFELEVEVLSATAGTS